MWFSGPQFSSECKSDAGGVFRVPDLPRAPTSMAFPREGVWRLTESGWEFRVCGAARHIGAGLRRAPTAGGWCVQGPTPGRPRANGTRRSACGPPLGRPNTTNLRIALPTPVVGVASRISGGKSTDSAGVRYAYRLFWCRDGQADGTSGSRVSVLTRHGQELCAARCVAAPLAPFGGLSYVPTVRRAGRRHAQRGVRERPPGPQFS